MGKVNAYDKIVNENQKIEKHGNKRNFTYTSL